MRKPPQSYSRYSGPYPASRYQPPQHQRAPRPYYPVSDNLVERAVVEGESFAELFEASLSSPRKAVARKDPEVGELVQGEIVQIGTEFAFLDIGGKSEAMISLDELRGDNGELVVQIGDKLEGHVVSVAGKEGGVVISGRLQRGAGFSDQLRQAYQQGAPVQGLVTGLNKGGLDVDLGGVRAFLPVSQIELRYCQEPNVYLGRALTLRVTRFDEESRTVIVSRRAALEVELRPLAAQTRARLQPGTLFAGTVVALPEPNAIIDLGGIDGILPTSELHAALRNDGREPDDLKVGQRAEVEVMRIEEHRGAADPWLSSLQDGIRVHLKLRSLLADPLDEMLGKLTEGQRIAGRVVRLEPFGAFVEVAPGVEGLIHISAMAERHISHPREVLTLGQDVTPTVVSLDRERRRIGLSLMEELRAAQAAVAATLPLNGQVRVRIERIEPNGALVRVLVSSVAENTQPRGLIPNSELGVPRGSDVRKQFPVGREHTAVVMSVDGEGRVRLSLRLVAVQAAMPEPAPQPAAPVAETAPASTETPVPAEAAPATTKARAPRAKKSATTPAPAAAPAEEAAPKAEAKPETKAKPRAKAKPAAAEAPAAEVTPVATASTDTPTDAVAKAVRPRAPRKKAAEQPAAEHIANPEEALKAEAETAKAPRKRAVKKTA